MTPRPPGGRMRAATGDRGIESVVKRCGAACVPDDDNDERGSDNLRHAD